LTPFHTVPRRINNDSAGPVVVVDDAIEGRLLGVMESRASTSAERSGDIDDAKVKPAGLKSTTVATRPPSTTERDASAALIARSAAASARAASRAAAPASARSATRAAKPALVNDKGNLAAAASNFDIFSADTEGSAGFS